MILFNLGGTAVSPPRAPESGWRDDGTVVRLTTVSDNVGIGTATPGQRLTVRSDASVSIIMSVRSENALNEQLVNISENSRRGQIEVFEFNSARIRLSAFESSFITNPLGVGTPTGTAVDEQFHVAEATDGPETLILVENSEPAATSSVNETAEIRAGFGGNNDVGRIVFGKEGDYTIGANEDSFLTFYTDLDGTASERMRITSAGNVGIGVAAPDQRLHLFGGNLRIEPADPALDSNANSPRITFLSKGNSGGTIRDQEWRVFSEHSGNFGTGDLVFQESSDGGAFVERMRISESGGVTADNLKNHALIVDRSPATESTTSSTFITLRSSAATTFSGRPVLCLLSTSLLSDSVNSVVEFAIQIDTGADVEIGKQAFNVASAHSAVTGAVIITPTAGSHIIRLRWRLSVGSGQLTFDSNDQILVHGVEL